MSSILLSYDITPKPKQSARFAASVGNNSAKVVSYQPKELKAYSNSIMWLTKAQYKGPRMDGALIVRAEFVFKAIKSLKPAHRKAIESGELVRKTTKPDNDNLWKPVGDAIEGIAYTNDSQISELQVAKYYGNKDQILVYIQNVENVTTSLLDRRR